MPMFMEGNITHMTVTAFCDFQFISVQQSMSMGVCVHVPIIRRYIQISLKNPRNYRILKNYLVYKFIPGL